MSIERFPAPSMHNVTGKEYVGATGVLEMAEQAMADARLPYGGNGGNYFLFVEETLTVPGTDYTDPGHLQLKRTEWNGDDFLLSDLRSKETPRAVVRAVGPDKHGLERLEGQGLAEFGDLARSIGDSAIRGTHRRSVVKFIDPQIALEVAVSRSTVGEGIFPVTSLDLRLMRSWGDGDHETWVSQATRVESDPNTGTVQRGGYVLAEGWDTVTVDQSSGEWEKRPVTIPFPQAAVAVLHERRRLPIPLDRPVGDNDWARLLLRPLDPRNQAN